MIPGDAWLVHQAMWAPILGFWALSCLPACDAVVARLLLRCCHAADIYNGKVGLEVAEAKHVSNSCKGIMSWRPGLCHARLTAR